METVDIRLRRKPNHLSMRHLLCFAAWGKSVRTGRGESMFGLQLQRIIAYDTLDPRTSQSASFVSP
jgi:hypothetical protein